MSTRIRERLIGAALMVPLIPIAWFARGVVNGPQVPGSTGDPAATPCDCHGADEKIIEMLGDLTRSVNADRIAAHPVELTRINQETGTDSKDLRTELNRYFGILWQTGFDDEFGIRKTVLESGRTPYDAGVQSKLLITWNRITELNDQMRQDLRSMKGRYPLVTQYPESKDAPETLRKPWLDEVNAYSKATYDRREQFNGEVSILVKELRASLSKE